MGVYGGGVWWCKVGVYGGGVWGVYGGVRLCMVV